MAEPDLHKRGKGALLSMTIRATVPLGLAAVLLCVGRAAGQPAPPWDTATDNAPLRLELKLKSKRYCEGDVNGGALQLKCDLRFINVGKGPLILYKGAGAVSEVLATRAPTKLQTAAPEYRLHVTTYSTGTANLDSDRPGASFVVLGPSDSFGTEQIVPIMVAPGQKGASGFLTAGRFSVEVTVDTSPVSKAGELQAAVERWRNTGYLWTRAVRSQPVLVDIDPNPKWRQCK